MIRRAGMALVALFLLLQLVPYGRDHTNPPVRREPAWPDGEGRELVNRACYDCHSNETRWLWYHHVAPLSWGVQRDVDEGRATLNFSEWDRPSDEADEAVEVVVEGEMPPLRYLLAHPEARLDDADRRLLVETLRAALGDRRAERDD